MCCCEQSRVKELGNASFVMSQREKTLNAGSVEHQKMSGILSGHAQHSFAPIFDKVPSWHPWVLWASLRGPDVFSAFFLGCCSWGSCIARAGSGFRAISQHHSGSSWMFGMLKVLSCGGHRMLAFGLMGSCNMILRLVLLLLELVLLTKIVTLRLMASLGCVSRIFMRIVVS